ncbi:MAG: hypothetical protein ACXVDZ_02850 [Bacteroidia bacterium]
MVVIYHNSGVIVARTNSGTYIAVSQACTNAGASVTYQAAGNDFSSGVNQGPATSTLKQYTCDLSGTSLRVHG